MLQSQDSSIHQVNILNLKICIAVWHVPDCLVVFFTGLSLYVALNPHFRNTFSLATGKKDIPGRTDGENDLENQELWNHQITSIFLFAG